MADNPFTSIWGRSTAVATPPPSTTPASNPAASSNPFESIWGKSSTPTSTGTPKASSPGKLAPPKGATIVSSDAKSTIYKTPSGGTIEDKADGTRVATLPAHLGGGSYTINASDPSSVVNTGHTTYGNEPAVKGSERDDIVPVSLGGRNSDPNNIQIQPGINNGPAAQSDKLEQQIYGDYKSGKIPLGQARVAAITGKYAINNPNYNAPTPKVKPVSTGPMKFPIGEGLTKYGTTQAEAKLQEPTIPVEYKSMGQKAADLVQYTPRAIAALASSLLQLPSGNPKTVYPSGKLATTLFGTEPIQPLGVTAAQYEDQFKQAGAGKASGFLGGAASVGQEFLGLWPIVGGSGKLANEVVNKLSDAIAEDTGVTLTRSDMAKIANVQPGEVPDVSPAKINAWKIYTEKADAARAAAKTGSVEIPSGTSSETPLSQALKKASNQDIFGRGTTTFSQTKPSTKPEETTPATTEPPITKPSHPLNMALNVEPTIGMPMTPEENPITTLQNAPSSTPINSLPAEIAGNQAHGLNFASQSPATIPVTPEVQSTPASNLPEVNPKVDTSVTLHSGFNPGVDKFIAEDVKPAVQKVKEVASVIGKTTQRIIQAVRGVLNADAPVRKNLGAAAYSDVIRAIHLPEAERITFDQNFSQTEKWFEKFTDKQLKNFNLSRGTPGTAEASALQQEAKTSLPEELKAPEVTQSIKQASDYVFKLATDAGLELSYFEDYFRGVYKDASKVKDFLDYWRSTTNYTKNKVFPSIADAASFGLELKDPNPIRNIRSELEAVTKRIGLKQLRDKLEANPLNKTFAIEIADATMLQRQEWKPIHDPVFAGMLFDPQYARFVDNLITTNKINQNLFTKGLRQLNNLIMQVKFTGSLFHLGNELKAAVSQEAFGVADPRGYKDFITSFKPTDTTAPAYKDYVALGGGHRYSLEVQALDQWNKAFERIKSGNIIGAAIRVGTGAVSLGTSEMSSWMFNKFIPKLKYEKFTQDVQADESKLGRPLTDAEKINIIKRNQNFYGEMNERLFGRSGTATSAARLFFQAPGYGEGNFRTFGRGFTDPKSARFVLHSLLTTLVLATLMTRILTGHWPKKPKNARDVRDLFKIKTNQKDGNGDTIYYDAMTYDKDYYSILGNALTGQFGQIGTDLTTRLSGSIGGLPKAMTDIAAILEGKIVVDYKASPIYNLTDSTPVKIHKFLNYEFGTLSPISVNTFQSNRKKGQGVVSSAFSAIAGVQPTTSEEVKHLKAIRNDLFSLQDVKKQEQIKLDALASTNPDESVKEAKQFNLDQMKNLKTIFKDYPNITLTDSLYFLSSVNPKSETSSTTPQSITGH